MMTSSVQNVHDDGLDEQQKQGQPDVQNLPTTSGTLTSGITPSPTEYMMPQGFEAGQTMCVAPSSNIQSETYSPHDASIQ